MEGGGDEKISGTRVGEIDGKYRRGGGQQEVAGGNLVSGDWKKMDGGDNVCCTARLLD